MSEIVFGLERNQYGVNDRAMKILFLSESFYPHGGGAELATHLYAKLLDDAGFDICVVTNRFNGEPDYSREGNIEIYRWPLSGTNGSKYSILSRVDLLISSSARKLMEKAELVYIPRFWYSAILSAKAKKKPVMVHLHDYIPVCPLSNLYNRSEAALCCKSSLFCEPRCIYSYEKSGQKSLTRSITSTLLNSIISRRLGDLLSLSNAIVCVSKAQKDLIEKRAAHLANKLNVVYNPLPSLPLTEMDGMDFGYFGGPHWLKGFNILLKALAHTRRAGIRAHATNFSEKTIASVKKSFGSLAKHLCLHERLNGTSFENLWKQLRAVVVPSLWPEPLPYVVSESLMRGRILVASNVGGIPEQVTGCDGVFLCESGEYAQFAKSIDYVANLSEEKAFNLGLQNRETFLKRFDNRDTIRAFIDICDKLV